MALLDDLINQQYNNYVSAGDQLRQRKAQFESANQNFDNQVGQTLNSDTPISSVDILNSVRNFQNSSRDYVNQPAVQQSDALAQLLNLIKTQQAGQPTPLSEDKRLDYELKARQQGLTLGTDENGNTILKPLSEVSGENAAKNVELKATQANDQALLNSIFSEATQALNNFKAGAVGPLDAFLGGIKVNFGVDKPGNQAYRSQIDTLSNEIRKYLSGAAINESEQKYLMKQIPKSSDSDQKIKEKLAAVKSWVLNRTQGNLTVSGYTDVDPTTYLNVVTKQSGQDNDPLKLGL